MTIYSYKAVDERGVKHKGVLEADNTKQLRQQLRTRGLMVLEVEESGGRKATKGPRAVFSSKALTAFTRELAILVEGGLQLEKALQIIATQNGNMQLRERILAIHTQVVEGVPFSSSLSSYPEDFPALYRATITAGEHAGDIVGVLNKLADYGETHLRTMNKVKLAMMYPVILAAFSILVVIGLMVYVFPDVTKVFVQSGRPLPWVTLMLINVSDILKNYGLLILLAIVMSGVVIRQMLQKPEIQLDMHRKLLTLPLVSKLVVAMNLARFTSTLSILRNSNVPLAEALGIASNVISNRWLRKSAEEVTNRVIEGSSLNQALTQIGGFPPTFISMIAGGEASGELDRILTLAAHNQMKELENRILFGVAILEPVVILALGFVVLIIVLAIMMPILSMNQLVK